jgi:hypothetical protein
MVFVHESLEEVDVICWLGGLGGTGPVHLYFANVDFQNEKIPCCSRPK